MSSHYIYLACSTNGCNSHESIYTGDVQADDFEDSGPHSWEGETIRISCKKCNEARDTA